MTSLWHIDRSTWYIFHERMSEEGALAKWKACKRSTDILQEKIDGRWCIAVKQFRELERTDQIRSTKRSTMESARDMSPEVC